MTPDSARQRSPRGEGEHLRGEILEAAERMLLDVGDADRVSVRAIARAVGVSPGSIYLHFGDKQDLVFAVCEQHFAHLDRHLAEAAAGHADPLDRLRAMGRAYADFGLRHPEAYRMIFMTPAPSAPDRFNDERLAPTAAFGQVLETVQACIDAGRFRPDLDAWRTALVVWSAVHGITSLLLVKPQFPWPEREALLESVCDASVAGFLA